MQACRRDGIRPDRGASRQVSSEAEFDLRKRLADRSRACRTGGKPEEWEILARIPLGADGEQQ